jgi:protein LSM14
LISKKNIRYEGVLYSINESDATVALQDVKSFGTEGREKTDPSTAFVPPQDAQHAFLVFRGQDIKDLHVHEAATPASEPALPEDPAIISSTLPPDLEAKKKQQEAQGAEKGVFDDDDVPKPHPSNQSSRTHKQQSQGGASSSKKPQEQRANQSGERRPRKKTDNQVGTGASLLNRKARGVVDGSGTFIFSWILKSAH